MMRQYYARSTAQNYEEAKIRITKAMLQGEPYVLLPGKNGSEHNFSWAAMPETIVRLRQEGFDIDKVWDPYEYWSVEWGYEQR